MSERPRFKLGVALLVGVVYFAAGFVLAALAGTATSDEIRRFWRLSAWIVSGIAFVAHIAYEHFRLHQGGVIGPGLEARRGHGWGLRAQRQPRGLPGGQAPVQHGDGFVPQPAQ